MCKIRAYQVFGDMTADKSRDAYPMKDLCEECASSYEILSEESPMGDICEDCGCDDTKNEEQELNEVNE